MTEADRFDVVVVGGGTAGVPCAIAAAEAGATVAVVEKTDQVGGTLHLSSGQLSAAGTRRQHARGIVDNPDRHFADVMALTRGTADPVIVRKAVDEAPRTIDWLEDLGFQFDPETPVVYCGHEPYPVARTYWGTEGGRSILAVIRPPFDARVAAGAITLLLEHRAQRLLCDDGRIVGVRAEGPDGPVELHGSAVVLTTGGYGANHEFFQAHTPAAHRLISACRRSSTGDGIVMGIECGATLRGAEHHLPTVCGIEAQPGSGYAGEPPRFAVLNPNLYPPRALHVNARGERFLAEDDPSPDRRERALLHQPDQRLWVVFDDASLADGRSFHPELSADQIRQLADYGGFMFRGADPGTLARRAGIDPAGLERTVEAWNRSVQTGEDPLGVREPGPAFATAPFYAVALQPVVVATFGGLAVDGELRVLDRTGTPIPGLYAAGEALGACATSGNCFCGGMLATPALSLGRILGRTLAVDAAQMTTAGMTRGGA